MCTFCMALRVLLADESSTIKKVMQLALQDFGVEVKAVPIGLDVLQVARSFMPDIIFADVLLSKKNGYEVSSELKADSVAKRIPVVLMWSGFMEIDEAKAQASGADRRLEKPFDADTLRSLIRDLCPVVKSNVISEFLTFPEMPSMVEDAPAPKIAPQVKKTPAEVSFDDFEFEESSAEGLPIISEMEEPEEFQSVPLPKNQGKSNGLPTPPKAKPQPGKDAGREDWSRQDLSKYKIELPVDDEFPLDEEDLTRTTSIALSSSPNEISLDEIDEPKSISRSSHTGRTGGVSKTFGATPNFDSPNLNQSLKSNSTGSSSSGLSSSALSSLDPLRLEELLRQEARSAMENIAWKIIPEIVERVVREELQKLLKEAERL